MLKNIVIAILMITIVGLSVSLRREMRFPKTVIEQMPVAVENQTRIYTDLASQVRWLRRHLEKTLGTLEAEHGLEPIPLQFLYYISGREVSPSEYFMESDSFVMPYQKLELRSPIADPNELGTEIGFGRAMALINLNSQAVWLATADMEKLIDNFYQRLQRLEPEIDREK